MQFTVTIDNPNKIKALSKALAAYNSAQATPILGDEFVNRLIDGQLDGLVQSYLRTKISKLELLDRFTQAEQVAILTAAQTDMNVAAIMNTFNAAPPDGIDLTSERTITGVQGLENLGLLTTGRSAEILAL